MKTLLVMFIVLCVVVSVVKSAPGKGYGGGASVGNTYVDEDNNDGDGDKNNEGDGAQDNDGDAAQDNAGDGAQDNNRNGDKYNRGSGSGDVSGRGKQIGNGNIRYRKGNSRAKADNKLAINGNKNDVYLKNEINQDNTDYKEMTN